MYNQMDSNMNTDTNQQQIGDVQPNYVGHVPSGSNSKTNTLAIVGFILSFFFGLVGAILCIVALGKIKKTGEKGKGFAIAGIIIGLLPLVASVILIILFSSLVWPNVQSNLAFSSACSMVHNNGNYVTYEADYGEDGYVEC